MYFSDLLAVMVPCSSLIVTGAQEIVLYPLSSLASRTGGSRACEVRFSESRRWASFNLCPYRVIAGRPRHLGARRYSFSRQH